MDRIVLCKRAACDYAHFAATRQLAAVESLCDTGAAQSEAAERFLEHQ